jgi:cytochrome c-type biogenesis protein CcmE
MSKRIRILAAFGALVVALAVLVGQGLRGTMVYSITVSEMVQRADEAPIEGLRVEGKVVTGSIVHRPTENYLRFEMTDGKATVPVLYRGIVPDTFGNMGEVTVEGSYMPDGVFHATFLMAKCPSKYEMDPSELERRGEHPGGGNAS